MKLLQFLLFPFAILYDIVTSIRNWFFDIGILSSTSFDIPVIAVGNLSVGGTGKTPQIEYLINLLQGDYKIAVLSRGYKRKTKGFIKINASHTALDVGDEPLQFFKKFGNDVTIAVDANRTNGITQLLKDDNPPEVVLLDDAFQHRKVKAKSYILLTKYDDLYTDDFLLPTGNLRESKNGAKRAETIIITKCPKNISVLEQENIRKKINPKAYQQVFFTAIEYDTELKGNKNIPIETLNDKSVLLITGIANPKPLVTYFTKKGINFTHLPFPDHHHFSEKDLVRIKTVFHTFATTEKLMITTEKDYVRLENNIKDLYYIGITSKFINDTEKFNRFIKNKL